MGATHGLKRAVLDTNTVIPALLFGGSSAQLAALWRAQRFVWLASASLVEEYTRVLAYPKFRLQENEISEILNEDILPFITPIEVRSVPAIIRRDPADDQFLACAIRGRADAIVSGDAHLLDLGSHKNIPVLRLAEFFQWLDLD